MQRRKVDSFDMWRDYMNLNRVLQQIMRHDEEEDEEEEMMALGRTKMKNRRQIWTSSPKPRRDSENSAGSSSGGSTPADYCCFCKQNGESSWVFTSHTLRGKDGKILCPVLQKYTCPICHATGENAHTRRYCPQVQRLEAEEKKRPLLKFW